MRVALAPHDPEWPRRFENVHATLAAALGPQARAVEHFGSTSIPGLAAKPILDVLVARASEARFDAWARRLAPLGYAHAREDSTGQGEGQWFFRDAPRTVHVHVYQDGTRAYRRHLAFRDALRRDAGLRDAYAALKRELAQREWATVQDYADAKTAFIRRVEKEALGE